MLDLAELFDEYEQLLLSSPAVASFEIIRRRIQDTSAYLRLKIKLVDDGLLEVPEYWADTPTGEIVKQEYTYHWQSRAGELISRWDNAAHHPELPNAPHHRHQKTGVSGMADELPTLAGVLKEIETELS